MSSDQADPAALPRRRSWTRQRETKGGIAEGMVPTCLVPYLRFEPLQTLVRVSWLLPSLGKKSSQDVAGKQQQ